MLLNLFLAILLNSIMQIGEEDEAAAPADAAVEAEAGEDGQPAEPMLDSHGEPIEEPHDPNNASDGDAKHVGPNRSLMNPSVSVSANAIDNGRSEMTGNKSRLEEPNDSNIVNSSNSNIEEEFAQIKNQLMALSKNMTNLMEKDNKDARSQDAKSAADTTAKGSASEKKAEDVKQEAVEEEKENNRSLFLFSYDNAFRAGLRSVISNSYFAGFIYTLIALNSLLLALDEPQLTDPYQKATITLLLTVISIIFVGECFVKIIVLGFYCGERTYLKDSWNVLDFVIVLFSFLTWGLEAFAGSDLQFVRGFRALRALRPLRVVSKNEGIKTVVNALLESIPALLNVLLIVLLFLLVFGILGIQLFKGKMGSCSDVSETIRNKT